MRITKDDRKKKTKNKKKRPKPPTRGDWLLGGPIRFCSFFFFLSIIFFLFLVVFFYDVALGRTPIFYAKPEKVRQKIKKKNRPIV